MKVRLLYCRLRKEAMKDCSIVPATPSRRELVLALSVLMLTMFVGLPVHSQSQSSATSAGNPTPVPSQILWFHFLSSVNHNDAVAAKLQAQGRDGGWLRNAHQRRLGFTDQQFAPIRSSAQQMRADLDEMGKKIQTAKQAAHLQVGEKFPPEVSDLMKQRQALVANRISSLQATLGPETSGILTAYLRSYIAPKVTTEVAGPDPSVRHAKMEEILLQKLQQAKGVQR